MIYLLNGERQRILELVNEIRAREFESARQFDNGDAEAFSSSEAVIREKITEIEKILKVK